MSTPTPTAHHPSDPTSLENWLTFDQAGRYLGVNRRLVKRLVTDGSLPARRLKGAMRIPRRAIDRWLWAAVDSPAGNRADGSQRIRDPPDTL